MLASAPGVGVVSERTMQCLGLGLGSGRPRAVHSLAVVHAEMHTLRAEDALRVFNQIISWLPPMQPRLFFA